MNETYQEELFFDSSMTYFLFSFDIFFNGNIIMCFFCGFWGTPTCRTVFLDSHAHNSQSSHRIGRYWPQSGRGGRNTRFRPRPTLATQLRAGPLPEENGVRRQKLT